MTKIPTAEEFFSDKPSGASDIEYWAKEFAKLHVIACKKAIYDNLKLATLMTNYKPSQTSILNSYPLENIK